MASFVFAVRERAKIVFFLCFMTVFSTLGGFYSKLTLSYSGLLLHGCYCISFIGGFYIYIIIDMLLTMDSGHRTNINTDDIKNGKVTKIGNDTLILLLSSLPLFGLFVMGIYSVVLVFKLDEEYEARKMQENQPDQQNNGNGSALLPIVEQPSLFERQRSENVIVSINDPDPNRMPSFSNLSQ